MIHLYKKYSMAWNSLAFCVTFWALYYTIPLVILKEVSYDLSLLVTFGTFGVFLRDAYYIYKDNDSRPSSLLILSIFLVCTVYLQSRIVAALNFYFNRPTWITEGPLGAWLAVQFAASGILLVIAVWRAHGKLQYEARRTIIVGVVIAAFLAGAVFARFGPMP